MNELEANTLTEAGAAERGRMDAWWRAASGHSVGQICLLNTPVWKQPLQRPHIENRGWKWSQ